MKILKWILGLLAGIGGIIALFAGGKSNKKVKEIKSNIKDNENKTKVIDKQIAGLKETDETLKKTLESKKQALEEIEEYKKKIKPKKKSAKKAHSRLKNIGKGNN
tara:strand:+ start:41 stop:355 length:315 start_codon:yes stop_codon:yes gene_type:complete